MPKADEKKSSPGDKAPTKPICSNCGSEMESQAGGQLRCPKCGNEERGD